MGSEICQPNYDAVFGPAITSSCRSGFDFTLMFEQSIMSILPSSLLLLVIPWRAYRLYNSSIKIVPSPWIWGRKATNSLILVCLQFALLILWFTNKSLRTPASLPAAILVLVCFLAICQLSYMEHTRSIRPSTIITLYLLFSSILDIPQARTLYLRHDSAPIAGVFSVVLAFKLSLVVLETQSKIHWLKEPYKSYPPEAVDGILSRTVLWWLVPLFWKGFKRILTVDDLFAIDPGLSSETLRNSMVETWDRRSQPENRFTLPLATTQCLRWAFLSIVPPRLALIGFTFAQPFLISTTITYVSQPIPQQNANYGLGLIAASCVIYTGVAISTVLYKHQLYRSITLMRGALVGLIYNHALGSPDGLYDESAAVTLMSTDIDRIALSMQNLHEIWARTIEVAISIWLLEKELGAVCIVPIILVAIIGSINTGLSNMISGKQRIWNQAIQRRIAMTSSMLNSMKIVKMMGLSSFLFKAVQGQRSREMDLAKGYRWMFLVTNVLANMPQIFAPALTFVAFGIEAYIRGSDTLSTNQAFTSLSIITLMTNPASQLLQAIPQTAACLGCFERIQKHILSPRRKDQRLVIGDRSPALSPKSPKEIGIELQTLGLAPTNSQNSAITDPNSRDRSTILSEPNGIGILVRDLTVRPTPISEPVIVDLNLQLERSSITMMAGPVGCGKSTLFRALLGELTPDKGSISVSSSKIAYCAQTPWLPNQSIQKCICGSSERPDPKHNWYQSVLHACCLDEDLLQFPQSDQTTLGNRGLTLSGGQKQRVALARAIYARQDILLLDDVLSALDTKTQQLIVERLLGQQGLLRKSKSTVVLITSTTRYFHLADHIVVLSPRGTITQQGSFNSLREEEGYFKNLILSPTPVPGTEITAIKNISKTLAKFQGPNPDQVSDLTRKTGDVSVYLYYYKSMTVFSIVAFLASSAIAVFCRYFPQVWLKWWTEASGAHIAKYLTVYVILALLALVFRVSTLWWSLILIAPRSSLTLHYTLLKTAINAPQSYYTKTDIGATLNRFSQDMGLIDRNLPLASTVSIFQLFSCMAQAALISTGSAYMACTLPLAIGGVYVLQKFYLLTSRQLRYLDLEARSPLYTQFIETLEGLSTIRAMGWQTSCLEMNTQCLDVGQRPYYLLFCIQRWLNFVLDLMVTVLATVVVAMAVKIPSSTTGAAIGIALNNVLGFTQSLSLLVDNFTQLETSLGAIARLKNFETEVTSEHLPGEIETPPENWPQNGLIEFRGVTAAYESSASPVLRNISMTIYPGQKIGICGRTGRSVAPEQAKAFEPGVPLTVDSGKSSLLLTLLRILEIQSGNIFIDGVDLSTIPREKVRTSMTTIPQDPFILNDTVRTNADPTGVVSDDTIISALSKVKLWDTIESRGGLDAQMKVQPLSHGQHQLFVLARAILCKDGIKILILDEATSQVDLETDQLMQNIIRKEFKAHVIITVAHRLNTILDSDRVAVLSHGELVEFGDPRELMERPSWFRDMHG